MQSHMTHREHRRVRRGGVRRRQGFSLIELLVVIAIIGLLTTIVMASLTNTRMRGRDGRRIADIKQLQVALEMYYDFNGAYPTVLSALASSNFIAAIPNDPRSGLPYAYVALRGAGGTSSICASYHLGVRLEVYSTSSGSNFGDDADTTAGGTYPSGDGTICSGSTWAGNADVPSLDGDFNGTNDATNKVYDMRP